MDFCEVVVKVLRACRARGAGKGGGSVSGMPPCPALYTLLRRTVPLTGSPIPIRRLIRTWRQQRSFGTLLIFFLLRDGLFR